MNDTKSSMRTIYPTDEDYHRICRVNSSGKTCIDVFIRPITEKQAKQSFTSHKSILQRWYHIVYKPYHHYLFHERQTLYRQDRRVLRG